MELGKKGKFDEGSADILSELPNCVIHCIMNCLPVGDAVRTSVLSKRFRHCWKGTQVLRLDEIFYKDYIEGKDGRYEEVLESVLGQLDGPFSELELYNPPSIMEVETLNADTRTRKIMVPLHRSHLTKLSMKNICLAIPKFVMCGFSNLVSLSLFDVGLDVMMLEDMICKSPKLKSLVLIRIVTAGNNPLIIDAHKLRTFEYRSSLSSLSLRYLPCLTSATIHSKIEFFAKKSERSPFQLLFSLMPKIEELNLDDTALSSLTDRKVPENVQKVSLNSAVTPKFLSCAMSLIRTSLNLKKLELNFEEVTLNTDPHDEAELQFTERELLDGIEVAYSRFLHAGQFNDVIASIREIIRTAIMIRENRNHRSLSQ